GTTVCSMVYQEGTLRAGIERGLRDAATSLSDFAFHVVVTDPSDEATAELPSLVRDGHTGLKIFMVAPRFEERITDYVRVLRAAAAAGMLVAVHAEDHAVVARATAELHAAGRDGVRYFPESRPPEAEDVAIRSAAQLAAKTGASLYLVHLSSRAALAALAEAKARGLRVYGETRPLYLYLTRERFERPDERMVDVPATSPARIAGLRGKGEIAIGNDADIVVFDPEETRTIRASEMHSACDYDPYEGWVVTGWPRLTLLRGEVAYESG